jgi:hypothetical protein
MGSSIAMIDYHYGHLAHDSREHAVSLLDALALERAVDAGWTCHRSPQSLLPPRFPGIFGGDRPARWTLGGRRDARWSSPR